MCYSHWEVIIAKSAVVSKLSANSIGIILSKQVVAHSTPVSSTVDLHQTLVDKASSCNTNLTRIWTAPNPSTYCKLKSNNNWYWHFKVLT